MTPQIRKLSASECRLMVDWAAAEGWNPGTHDADAFRAADPDGYWGLFDGETLIATISAVRYPSGGQGLGYRLWQQVLGELHSDCVGLDGVVDQQTNYRKSGFALAHRNIRCGGSPTLPAGDERNLRSLGPSDAPTIAAFEQAQRLFPSDRTNFLRAWLAMPGTTACAIDDGAGVTGYGAIRPCGTGWKIGPLFAAGYDDALALTRRLVHAATDGPVFLDVPEPNEAARRLAAQLGLTQVFETARMYRGAAPDLSLERIFGITSFELG